ncbi:MAG TPA: adenylate/guanylate cyclase domain-containing protein [Gaiellales bacterium]
MPGSYRKSFDEPDETFELDGMVEHVVKIGDYTVGRVVQPPGFRWRTNVQPIVGGEWCAARHVGVVVSGRMGVELKDGTRFELGPDDVFDIPPGHDAYVVGDEPLVEIDWSGLEAWTGFKVRLHDRVLAGLLMTDVVGSTEEARKLGDAVWRDRLSQHLESLRTLLGRFRGREIDTAGDGMFALFDGAARALECAAAIQEAAQAEGMAVRIGVHVGEVELTSNGARGVAVHEVARIAALAGSGEVLTSEATRALSTGAGLRFEDRGTHQLKGLGEERRLFAFVASE